MPTQELPSRAAPSVFDASPNPTVQPPESYPEEGREEEDPQEKNMLLVFNTNMGTLSSLICLKP